MTGRNAYNTWMRFLGVDPGGRRMGLALGDDLTGIATPLEVVPCTGASQAVLIIVQRVEKYQVQLVVVGRPTAEDGSATPACKRSELIAAGLRERQLSVALQNEYLSTDEARRRAREAGVSRGQPVDHFAAQVLLEEFLDLRQSTPERSPE